MSALDLVPAKFPLMLEGGELLDTDAARLFFLSPNVWHRDLVLVSGQRVRLHRACYTSPVTPGGPLVKRPLSLEVVAA